jgi:hypothetical protein
VIETVVAVGEWYHVFAPWPPLCYIKSLDVLGFTLIDELYMDVIL